tara:strand:- start:280 stop:1287 length:1008 start_codon:yes stop_codon:yes gene_type:complete
MIRVAILGASGYTGLECIRLLQNHQSVTITHLFANKNANKPTKEFIDSPNLPQYFEKFDAKLLKSIDCLFIALPHTTVHPLMDDILAYDIKVIDLSADFRLNSAADYLTYYKQQHLAEHYLQSAVYGCPEYFKDQIAASRLVANPGCYAIASILAMKPLTDQALVKHVTIDAKSGVSGAGRSLSEDLLYCEVNEHIRAYSTNTHRHMAECAQLCDDVSLHFSPHLIPMSRGILASCYMSLTKEQTLQQIETYYTKAYETASFVRLLSTSAQPTTQNVVGTNRCQLIIKQLSKTDIVVFSAIDNLIKGAAGNAIQNMNIMFKLPEDTALPTIAQRI